MDLKSGYPFWPIRNGLMYAFPPLERDLACDVAIVGGGISAALIARELSRHGHEVAVLERRDFGWGSTSASTAMLQYEIDTHLVDLAKQHGEDQALLAYRACADAIDELAAVAKETGRVDFKRRDSLYYVSRRRDHAGVLEEFRMRQRHGFDVEWLGAGAVQERFGFEAPGAILSSKAASVDPYRFALRLFNDLARRGVHVHDRSTVETVQAGPRSVRLGLRSGATVRAARVVFAAGYENAALGAKTRREKSQQLCLHHRPGGSGAPRWPRRHAGVGIGAPLSLPAPDRRRSPGRGWRRRCDRHSGAARQARRLQDGRTEKETREAEAGPGAGPGLCWGGTFAETEDGLPFFGPHPATGPRLLFAMAYGGNGISYSMAGAALLRAWIEGRKHPLQHIFGFSRQG